MNQDIDDILQGIETALRSIIENVGPGDDIDGPCLAMENLLQRLLVLQPFLHAYLPEFDEVVENVQVFVEELKGMLDERETESRTKGAPSIHIIESELKYLLDMQFTQVEIGKLLGCSACTIRRRILDFGFQYITDFTQISDQDLGNLVTEFVSFPSAGQNSPAGYLQSLDHHIQQWRIHESMFRVDPWGVQKRSRCILHRRRYRVAGPNSLWHIDGNHKLTRWRIVAWWD